MTLFNTPVLYEHCLLVCVPLWQHSETVRTYSEMSSLLLLFAFQQLKITCFKPQCLKMCANNTFSWPCSTATSHDRVTMIETIVKNLYWLTNFYRLFLSTDISHTPTKNEKSFFFFFFFFQCPGLGCLFFSMRIKVQLLQIVTVISCSFKCISVVKPKYTGSCTVILCLNVYCFTGGCKYVFAG